MHSLRLLRAQYQQTPTPGISDTKSDIKRDDIERCRPALTFRALGKITQVNVGENVVKPVQVVFSAAQSAVLLNLTADSGVLLRAHDHQTHRKC
jgi:hypothetical protein